MADNTPMQQFEQGAKTIFQALRSALDDLGAPAQHIGRTVLGVNIRPHDSTFVVLTKFNRTESLMFTREEISNSAQSIDSFAAAKVRVLAGRVAAKTGNGVTIVEQR
jgi:hypothetical protein